MKNLPNKFEISKLSDDELAQLLKELEARDPLNGDAAPRAYQHSAAPLIVHVRAEIHNRK